MQKQNPRPACSYRSSLSGDVLFAYFSVVLLSRETNLSHPVKILFAAASPTLYYHIEPKFYVNFRQSEVFLNCNIHHTS